MTLVHRLLGGVAAVLFLLAVLVFASLAIGVLIVGAVVLWGWLWWRSRAFRHSMRGSEVIEGEFRDVTHQERLEERRQQRL